jgi:hypothetical protein
LKSLGGGCYHSMCLETGDVSVASDSNDQIETVSAHDVHAGSSTESRAKRSDADGSSGAKARGGKWVLPLLVGVGLGVIGASVLSSRPAPSVPPPPTAASPSAATPAKSVDAPAAEPPPSAAEQRPEPGIAVAIAPSESPEPPAAKPPEAAEATPAAVLGADPKQNAAAETPKPMAASAPAEKPAGPKPPPPSAAGAVTPAVARTSGTAANMPDAHKGGLPPVAAATSPEPPPSAARPAQPLPAARANDDPAPAPDSEEAKLAAASTVTRAPDTKIDAMLDDALTAPRKGPAPPPPPKPMPLTPSREDVTRVMTVLIPAIRGCAKGQSGFATVSVVVKNDGKVQSAELTGAPFEGTASGRCMEGVVRRMRLPAFQQEAFRVQFPFSIQ